MIGCEAEDAGDETATAADCMPERQSSWAVQELLGSETRSCMRTMEQKRRPCTSEASARRQTARLDANARLTTIPRMNGWLIASRVTSSSAAAATCREIVYPLSLSHVTLTAHTFCLRVALASTLLAGRVRHFVHLHEGNRRQSLTNTAPLNARGVEEAHEAELMPCYSTLIAAIMTRSQYLDHYIIKGFLSFSVLNVTFGIV